jgi:cyanophycinase
MINSAIASLIYSLGLLWGTSAYSDSQQSGALVIVGGGKVSGPMREEFVRLAGGKEKAKIVVIPSASGAADDPKEHESFLVAWREFKPASLVLLHTRDRKKADDTEFVKPIRKATAVWFSGGDQNRLITAYRGTLVEKEFHKLLERGGVIGGTSAGAAIMSDLMIQGGKDAGVKTGPGFGFVKGIVVDQHFANRNRQPRLRHVLSQHPTFAGLGIDEGTAATISGNEIKIIGLGAATAINALKSAHPKRERTFKDGGSLPLDELRRSTSRAN